MSIDTYNNEISERQSLIPLGISMDYQVKWNVHRIIRDFVQNFYDSIGYEHFAREFQYEWEVADAGSFPLYCIRNGDSIHIRMRSKGHTFSYEWLSHIGGSTKTGKDRYAGEYGEGFKISLLCLVKMGGNATMSSGNWILYPCEYTEEIDDHKIRMFGYRMEEREDDGFTTLDLYGIPATVENIRYVQEAQMEFFYPENILLGDRIESRDGYDLYGRSDIAVPCADSSEIEGILYYKYIAHGRLPFPAVIHITDKSYHFERDRSRELLSEAVVIGAVYQLAENLSPRASFWLLEQMKKHWKEVPRFRKDDIADLHTWYYVICQLVRNISTEDDIIELFVQKYPLENYAYIERKGSDRGRNKLLVEAKNWFVEENKSKNRRRMVNPVFRLLGVHSVFEEYIEKKETLYRKPDGVEKKYSDLIKECAKCLLGGRTLEDEFPEILVYTRHKVKGKRQLYYEKYGAAPHVEAQIEKDFSIRSKKFHIKYRVKAAVLDEEDLSAEMDFQKVLLKYTDACLRMYGTELSARSTAVLTDLGSVLYRSRNMISEFAGRWNTVEYP